MNFFFFLILPVCGVAAIGYFNRNTPEFRRLASTTAALLSWLGDKLIAAASRIRDLYYRADINTFSDLTPSNNIDPQFIYDRRINHAIHMPQIKNVALTGPYGSGKSSILLTFQKRHPEFQYLNISLASIKKEEDEEPDKMYDLIEASILQQIFYRVKYKEIPKSRFKRITKESWLQLSLKVVLIILSLVSIAIFWKKKQTLSILHLTDFATHHPSLTLKVQIGSVLVFVFLVFYTTLKIYSNSKLHKLSLSSGEIELATDDSSILNKHLDEILYFFEATKYGVVIFEDLDRFENPEIFTKLREINALLNNSLQINRKITFIYALKDEMFGNTNRTKFFDFIIPIIPVISSLNSADLLIQKIKSLGLIDDITPRFLQDISLFIDDMRLLKNIFTEFELYREQFSDSSLKAINLFALVLYKNTNPHDFALLQNDEGVAATLFKRKAEYIQILLDAKKKKVNELEQQISKVEASIAEDISEVRLMYIGALITNLSPIGITQLNLYGTHVSINDINNKENFDKLLSQNNFQYRTANGGWYNSNLSFQQIQQLVRPSTSYHEQEELLKLGKQRTIDDLKKKKEDTQYEISQIKSYNLKQIMSATDAVANLPELKENALLLFLIKNGYIDEQFPFYSAYFYEGILTKEDLTFVLSAKKDTPLPFDAALNNLQNILGYLSPLDFASDAVFNFKLTSYVISNSATYNDHWLALLKHLGNEQPLTIDYYEQYVKTDNDIEKFVVDLENHYWPDQCDFILNRSGYSVQKKDFHLGLLLKYYSIEQIESSERNAKISGYLNPKEDFLEFASDLGSDKAKAIIKKLDLRFTNLKNIGNQKSLFQYIYEYNNYSINQEMIQLIIDSFGTNGQLQMGTFDAILKSGCKFLIENIYNNLEQFIKNVFLTNNSYISEPEHSLLTLLNNENIDIVIRQNILAHTKAEITNIDKLDYQFWPMTIKAMRLKPTWSNVIRYHDRNRFDERLTAYINNRDIQKSLLIQWLGSDDLPEDNVNSFFEDMIKNPGILNETFATLIDNFPYRFNNIDLSSTPDERIQQLIFADKLTLNPYNLKALGDTRNDLKRQLILLHPEDYFRSPENFHLMADLIIDLLSSMQLKSFNKQILLDNLEISQITEDNANLLKFNIIQQKLQAKPGLIQKILEMLRDKSEGVILLTSETAIPDLAAIPGYLQIMGDPYSEILSNEGAQLAALPINIELLQFLQAKKLITGFNTDKHHVAVLPISN